jgi:hypothetical protein
MSRPAYIVDIEVYPEGDVPGGWAQGKYLYHGLDDVWWGDDIEVLLQVIREDLKALAKRDPL